MNYELQIQKLNRNRFRGGINLNDYEKRQVNQIGIDKIKNDAFEILAQKIRVKLNNDGKQTPWTGNVVFPAMHATATCCRKCIRKWYGIFEDKELTDEELEIFSNLIIIWIVKQVS